MNRKLRCNSTDFCTKIKFQFRIKFYLQLSSLIYNRPLKIFISLDKKIQILSLKCLTLEDKESIVFLKSNFCRKDALLHLLVLVVETNQG